MIVEIHIIFKIKYLQKNVEIVYYIHLCQHRFRVAQVFIFVVITHALELCGSQFVLIANMINFPILLAIFIL